MTTETINKLIDNWHICPYSDDVHGMFESLKLCTEAYLEKHPLDQKTIVNIVKDLRTYLNPHDNVNLYHFTDNIADSILLKFKGISKEEFSELCKFIEDCKSRVYTHI